MGANQLFVIVGGGLAGAWAAKTLRQPPPLQAEFCLGKPTSRPP